MQPSPNCGLVPYSPIVPPATTAIYQDCLSPQKLRSVRKGRKTPVGIAKASSFTCSASYPSGNGRRLGVSVRLVKQEACCDKVSGISRDWRVCEHLVDYSKSHNVNTRTAVEKIGRGMFAARLQAFLCQTGDEYNFLRFSWSQKEVGRTTRRRAVRPTANALTRSFPRSRFHFRSSSFRGCRKFRLCRC